jgi:hypothetical protein
MQEDQSFADLEPILSKWLLRLTWIGSIGFFQAVELHRYSSGQTYRPFFGLYASVLFALFAWFVGHAVANIIRRRIAARRRSRSTTA